MAAVVPVDFVYLCAGTGHLIQTCGGDWRRNDTREHTRFRGTQFRHDVDVAIMELNDGASEFEGNYKGKRAGKQCLFPVGTVLNGKRLARTRGTATR